jgi:hypothetical protein
MGALWTIIDFSQTYNGAVSAAATVFIAIFTVVLARVARVAGRNFREVERAFIFVEQFIVTPVFNDRYIRAWKIVPVFKNSGTTPSKNALLCMGVEQTASANELPDNFPFEANASHKIMPISIGPGAQLHGPAIEYQVVDLEYIRTIQNHQYIWGWVDYDDVFRRTTRHRSEFCFEVQVLGDPAINNSSLISLSPHKKYNGADSECSRPPDPYLKLT